MKKILKTLFLVLICFFSGLCITNAETIPKDMKKYDYNSDNKIDNSDLNIAYKNQNAEAIDALVKYFISINSDIINYMSIQEDCEKDKNGEMQCKWSIKENWLIYDINGDNKIDSDDLLTAAKKDDSASIDGIIKYSYDSKNTSIFDGFNPVEDCSTDKDGTKKCQWIITSIPRKGNLGSSCLYLNMTDCENSEKYGYACVWVDEFTGNLSEYPDHSYCNVDNLQYLACGKAVDFPQIVPYITSFIFAFLQIGTTLILIITGMIQLVKAITSGKEDEMNKAKGLLVKKLIPAILVFFVAAIVRFVVSIAADNDDEITNVESCIDCLINKNCDRNKYYKTNIAGDYYCTTVGKFNTDKCDKFLGITNEKE